MSKAKRIEMPAPDTRVVGLREGDCLRIAGAVLSVRRGGAIEIPAGVPVDFGAEGSDERAGGCLVLSLHPGDRLLLAGVLMVVRGHVRLDLLTRARMVFGRQYMAEEDASTPARRLYFLLQQVYAGPEAEKDGRLAELRAAVRLRSPAMAAQIEDAVRTGNCYPALCTLRAVAARDEADPSVAG